MANLKISQLTELALGDLVGAEYLPLVESATTKKVSSANLKSYFKNIGMTDGAIPFGVTSTGSLNLDATNFVWDNTNKRLGIGIAVPLTPLHILKTTEQLRLAYDANNYISYIVNADGSHTMSSVSGGVAGKAVRSQILNNATGDETAFQFNYTTNKAAGSDTGMRITMTDTASPGTSLLLELMNGATSLWKINQAGDITHAGFMTSAGGASLGGAANVNVLTAQPTGAVPLAIATTQYADNRSKYGEISFYTSTGSAGTAVAIDTTLLYHALALASPISGPLSGFTVIAGQSNAIASVAENSAGVSYKVTTTESHNLSAGDAVTHTGFTTRTTYRGKFIVQSTPSATEYIVLGTYLGTDTGFMKRGCGLKASTGSAGNYRLSYSTSFTADSNTTLFKIEVNKNTTDNDNIACQRYFSLANQSGNLVSNGFVTIADGDIVWLSCANLTDASDYKILHLNFNMNKI